MPHVSPQQVNKETLNKIYRLLTETITDPNVPKKQHQAFFDELLTPTEKVMLGKRLAAVALLSQGVSPYQTGKILHLSETTTGKLSGQIEKGKLKHLIKLCEIHRKGPLGRYLENLFRPLPRYGTSPSSLFKK